jgi:indolepyruvate ferredoxin oxidoreductase beta subunit
MNETTSVILSGVGGQGIILASRVLAEAALSSGYQVKVSEIHGMAQRGGSVVTHLRYGPRVYSPLISSGQADYVLGFEKLEAVRCLPFLKEGGLMIVNDQLIPPLPVMLGKLPYPELDGERLRQLTPRLQLVKAQEQAQLLGNAKAVNMVLLGCLARHLGLTDTNWEQAIARCVRPEYVGLNKLAFAAGLNEK